MLDSTATDAWLVLHDGVLVAEQYRGGMAPDTTHLLMSVTKSVVGTVAGILCERGHLATEDLVTRYVPELASGGYRGATVRNVLDMRSGVLFREDYADPDAHVRRMEAAIGWRPGIEGVAPGLHRFLSELEARWPARRAFRLPLVRDRRPGLGVRAGLGDADAGPHLRPRLAADGRRA